MDKIDVAHSIYVAWRLNVSDTTQSYV